MGILSGIITRFLKAKPFQYDPLDRLAETMNTTRILKRGKLQRYFRVPSVHAGAKAYSDAVFFDAQYYDNLLPEELLALGAHEFNHIIKRHDKKRFKREILPALVISTLLGLLAYLNYDLFNSIIDLSQISRDLFSLFIGVVSYFFLWGASFYFNADWLRQQETQSDLSAVRFANGEALISALTKLNDLYPNNLNRFISRIFPKTYPTLEERKTAIRKAMERNPTN